MKDDFPEEHLQGLHVYNLCFVEGCEDEGEGVKHVRRLPLLLNQQYFGEFLDENCVIYR